MLKNNGHKPVTNRVKVQQERMESVPRFGLRKLTVGVASVLLGLSFMGVAGMTTAHAATPVTSQQESTTTGLQQQEQALQDAINKANQAGVTVTHTDDVTVTGKDRTEAEQNAQAQADYANQIAAINQATAAQQQANQMTDAEYAHQLAQYQDALNQHGRTVYPDVPNTVTGNDIKQSLILGTEPNAQISGTVANDQLTIETGNDRDYTDPTFESQGNFHEIVFKDGQSTALDGELGTITYDHLQNSYYEGRRISKITVTFANLERDGLDDAHFGKHVVVIYDNLTRGIEFAGTSIDVTTRYYDENGNLITLNAADSYIAPASLNNSNDGYYTNIESVELLSDGKALQLMGSSVSANGKQEYAQESNGNAWDHSVSDDPTGARTYGTGLYNVSGDHVTLRFFTQLNDHIRKYINSKDATSWNRGSMWAIVQTVIPTYTDMGVTAPIKPGMATNSVSWHGVVMEVTGSQKIVIDNVTDLPAGTTVEQPGTETYTFTSNDSSSWEEAHQFDDVSLPKIPGYHLELAPSDHLVLAVGPQSVANPVTIKDGQEVINGLTVTPNHPKASLHLVYVADQATVNVIFEDSQTGAEIGAPQVIEGVVDGTVDTTKTTVPTGWVIDGTDPRTPNLKVGVNNPDVIVKIKHGTTDVSTTDAGATKTVTRTINVTTPDGQTKTTTQTATFHRTATKDLVTGEVTYGEWNNDQQWDAFTTSTIAGYTASQTNVAQMKVTADDKDQVVNIDYTANPTSVKVIFEDSQTGAPIGQPQIIKGVVDGTVDTTKTTVPTGWVIDGTDPRTPNLKVGVENPDVIVKVKHGTEVEAPQTKTVTRTINVKNPDGTVKTTTQTANFSRTATKDLVTGDVTYGEWNKDQEWDAYTAPTIDGYTASRAIAKQAVTVIDQNCTENIDYTANPTSVKVIFEDSQTGTPIGNPQIIKGVVDGTVDTTKTTVPTGWVIDGTDPRTPNLKVGVENPNVIVKVKHGTEVEAPQTKTATRTINVKSPDGTVKTTTQTANFSRTATKDLVTGDVTYGEWNNDQQWDAFTTPTIAGYTASQTNVAEMKVTADDQDQVVNIDYAANPTNVKVIFEDSQTGAPVGDPQVIEGTVDGTVDTTKTTVPTGWVIDGMDPRTPNLKVGVENPDVIVKIKHGTTDVSATDAGATKTVTRTINVTTPDGQTKMITQDATFHRTATKDNVTGEVTYGDWNDDQTWAAFTTPTIIGYTPSQTNVSEVKVTAADQNQVVNIGYTANDETVNVVFKDHNGNTIQTTPVTGKMDGTVDTTQTKIPDGWVLDGDDSRTTNVKLGTTNPDIIVKIKHGTTDVSTTDAGAKQTVTRTINVTTPDGQTKMITQDATFHRTATKDLVTGDVTYGKWNDDQTWADFKPAVLDGYTASKTDVPEVKVTADDANQTINIDYTANDETVNVVFKDHDGNTIQATPVTGKMDGTVDTTQTKIPDGWVLDGDDSRTTNVKLGTTNPDIIVKIKHGTTNVSTTDAGAKQTVTRTINVTTPDGQTKTITQTAHFTRSATKDNVTGEVTYGDWNDDQTWAAFTTPTIDGYTASQTDVPEVKVTADDLDQTVAITYASTNPEQPATPITPATDAVTNATNTAATPLQSSRPATPAPASQTATQGQLPQTGNQQDSRLAVLGLATLSLVGLGAGKLRDRRRQD